MILGRLPLYKLWKKSAAGTLLKRRRYRKLMALLPLPAGRKLRVLEVGCSSGSDMIQFLEKDPRFEVWGVDIRPCRLERGHFVQADGAHLPFPDKSFDLVASVGLLEHIEPMEKLCRVIDEMDRVGRHLLSVVPSVSTVLEPHCGQLLFPIRLHRELCRPERETPLELNFIAEHTWTRFHGFLGCKIQRFWYLPPLIRNTAIYK